VSHIFCFLTLFKTRFLAISENENALLRNMVFRKMAFLGVFGVSKTRKMAIFGNPAFLKKVS
jgi:hypothetical protein